MKTFKEAKSQIFAALEKLGWKVDRTLKNEKATHERSDHKLWFTAQSIYAGTTNLNEARSLHLPDLRRYSASSVARHLSVRCWVLTVNEAAGLAEVERLSKLQ